MFSYTSLQPKRSKDSAYIGPKAQSLSKEVHQSLLTFPPNFSILIDVGWDPALSLDLDYLVTAAHSINAILLTHASITHLGAYSYLCKISPEFAKIPVYSTLPVINMGRMVTLDAYRSKGLLGPVVGSEITLEDVEASFDKVIPLKYSQTVTLDPNSQDSASGVSSEGTIQITPYNAGHSLGGTIWKIVRSQAVILYAVDWNHTRDSHLNGAFLQSDGSLLEPLAKPSLMICGTKISEISSTLKKRKEALFKNVRETIASGGTVLIPTSTGSRVLELVHILDSFWEKEHISAPLLYFSHVGSRTLSYASSMLEWMSSTVIDEWQVQNQSPFDTKHLKVLSSTEELMKMDGPKVILASGEAMEVGFARQMFSKICNNDSSMVIITERSGPETLAGQLFDIWMKQKRESNDPSNSSKYLPVHLTTEILLDYTEEAPLSGEELVDYLETTREEKKQIELQSAIELRNKNILEQDDNEMSDDESDEQEDEMVMSGQMDIGIFLYGNDVYDYDVRTMPEGKPRVFPYNVNRKRVDDYGEVLKLEKFLKKKQQEEAEKAIVKPDPPTADQNKKNATVVKTQYNDETNRLNVFSSIVAPQKIVPKETDLKVLCWLDFIDFDGVTDWRSLKMILDLIEPRNLIFLPSCLDIKPYSEDTEMGDDGDDSTNKSTSETNVDRILADFQQQADMNLDLIAKAIPNEAIFTQIGSNTYSVIISPELEKLLKWQKILGDFSVAHVTGKLEVTTVANNNNNKAGQQQKAIQDVVMEGDDDTKALSETVAELSSSQVVQPPTSTTVVKLVPLKTAQDFANAPRSNPLMVGDIKLAELKRLLISKGHKAEFRAEGILVCDEKVAIRKLAQGNIVVEGTGISPEFYKVRNVVRSILAYV